MHPEPLTTVLARANQLHKAHAHPAHDAQADEEPASQDTHAHTEENEHLFGFKYWHFFDIISDVARSTAQWAHKHLGSVAESESRYAGMASRALPVTRIATRALPVVGVVGELMHVATPFEQARDDWRDGKLSGLKFGGLCALYGAYTITGLGGFLTAGIKEGLTNAAQHWHWMDERYIPHSLYQEFQHAGWFGGNSHDHHDHEHDHDHGHEVPARNMRSDRQVGPVHFHTVEQAKDCAICAKVMEQETVSFDAFFELSPPPSPTSEAKRARNIAKADS